MDCQTLGIALTVAGGAAELIGLGLVGAGILKDRRKARALFSDTRVRVPPGRSYGRSTTAGDLAGGTEPTEEERLKAVESGLAALAREVDDRLFEARKRTDGQVDKALQKAFEADHEVDAELRGALHDVLAGSIRGRWWGIGLLFAGIVLSVAGNWVGALA